MKQLGLIFLFVFAICIRNVHAQGYTKELPGGPGNRPAVIQKGKDGKSLTISYNNTIIFKGQFKNQTEITSIVNGKQVVEQHIRFIWEKENTLHAVVNGSSQALAAETLRSAQKKFAVVRTSHGLSNNLRNNAIYDRNFDWMLEAPEGTIIRSFRNTDGTTRFELTFTGNSAELVFRPYYYQKHKNLPHYQPWTYNVYKESITGWCSWWAYFREFTEKDHLNLLNIWQKKRLADYGYRFIQIDDVYQGNNDGDRKNCEMANGYLGGRPTTWLDWKKDIFPSGLSGYVTSTRKAGFDPAIWMGCFFSDEETVRQFPDWFVKNSAGKPAPAPWVRLCNGCH